MTRYWIAAACVIAGGLVGNWLVRRRRRAQQRSAVSPAWLNQNVYDREGDSRWP